MDKWTPVTDGALELSPILQPLAAFKDRLVVITGLDNRPALALQGEPAGGHGRIGAAFLTGVHAKPTEGADFRAGISIDQIAAARLGNETELASLELGLESTDLAGACDVGFSCAYVNTLSWRSPTTPLPMENNPRTVFERLFGDSTSTDSSARRARIQSDRSLLDSVTEKISDLQRGLGSPDRVKLTEYLDAVRDIERRIQKAEGQSARELPALNAPSGSIPSSFEEYAKVMLDLQVLAYQTDLTRVITFMIGKELSNRTYPEIGVPDPHHPLSHHQNDPQKLEKLSRVQTLHMGLLAYYLEKLARDAGWRRKHPRQPRSALRQRHGRQQHARSAQSPALDRGRRRRTDPRRTSPSVSEGDAAHESLYGDAGEGRRAGRTHRRQHRRARHALRRLKHRLLEVG